MINREHHIQPLTLLERFGCLGFFLAMICLWSLALWGCYECGRRHPYRQMCEHEQAAALRVVSAAPVEAPSCEIIP